MKNDIYIQARIGSSRLPAKVLKTIDGKTIIEIIYQRLQNIKNIHKIIVVTGPYQKNKKLIKECKKLGLEYFCGNEENILHRFYAAVQKFKSDNIIRITADCPLIDFNIVEKGLEIFLKNNFDILSNVRIRTFPHGFDFEIFTKNVLVISWLDNKKNFKTIKEFENTFINPTKYLLTTSKFKNYDLINKKNLSHIRLALDYNEDFILISTIYKNLYHKNKNFAMKEILQFLKDNPVLLDINKKYILYNNVKVRYD